jgi:hypothetical protein
MDSQWLDDFARTLSDRADAGVGDLDLVDVDDFVASFREPHFDYDGPDTPASAPESQPEPPTPVAMAEAVVDAPDALASDPVAGLESVPGTFTTNAENLDGFNIDLVFEGQGWTPDAAEQVISAAELVSTMFEGDLPDTLAADGTAIDDKQLTLTVDDRDGALLGVGGTSFALGLDAPAGVDATGFVQFDDQLVANLEGLDGVAYHEIMHTLGYGIGPVWDSLLEATPDGQLRFTGDSATEAYVNDFSAFSADDPFASLGAPVDSNGDHLDVDVFGSNLIESGFIDPGTPAEANLFELDMAIFEDLGYDTQIEDGLLVT